MVHGRGVPGVTGGAANHARRPAAPLGPAITVALTMGMVFGLALRQTEGLIGSALNLLGLDLAVPGPRGISPMLC